MYRQQRNYENLNKAMFEGVGEYGIPQLRPVHECDVKHWISFNYAKGCEEPEDHGVHFFIDDYQFMRTWSNPDTYMKMMRKFKAVLTPDFSTYTDFPKAIQLYNHYRKHWIGAYWQMNGVYVIPTISWAGPDSYTWCFDGEPVGGIVAVSTVGTQINPYATRYFVQGYREMMERLRPEKVIVYGSFIPDGCEGDIIHVAPFQQKWREAKDKGPEA